MSIQSALRRRTRRFRATALLVAGSMLASIVGIATVATITSATPAEDGNPDLPQRCGVDMTVIVDRSGSIGSQNDEVADAANALVGGLAGTGSSVQVISFSREATALTDANGDGDTDDLADLEFVSADTLTIPAFPSGGWTNWDDALEMARRSPAGIAPLTVVLTDGNPTAYNNNVPDGHGGPNTAASDGGYVNAQSLARAQQESDLLQAAGSHIFAVGIGSNINTANLQAISGNEEYTVGGSVPFNEADWTIVPFADLEDLFDDFVRDLCSPSVNIVKTEIPFGGSPQPGDGWTFDIALDASPGSFGGFWQSPALADTETDASLTTVGGSANFKWEFGAPGDSTGLRITEQPQLGWELTSVTCERRDFDDNTTTTLTLSPVTAADGSVSWVIPGGISTSDAINCEVVNTELEPIGTITVVKDTVGADGSFDFLSDFNGAFTLTTVDGSATTGAIQVDAGVHSVAETVLSPWELTSAVCDDGSPIDAIDVHAGEDVVCTFTNTAPDPTIDVTKTADVTTVNEPGGEVIFTIDIANTSVEPITIETINDVVEGGAPIDVTTIAGNTCAALIGTVLAPQGASGDTASCTFPRFVGGDGGTDETDVVTVTGSDDDDNPVSDDDDETVDIVDLLPGVALTKTASTDEVGEPGADVDFTFVVENTSSETLTVTSLVDTVFGDITADCGWAGLELDPADGTTGSGPDSATCVLTRFIGGNAGDTHMNVATVTGEDDEGNETTDDDDEEVDIVDLPPTVTIIKTADPLTVPEPGADVDFRFLIENDSPEPVTIVSLVDSVFGDLTGAAVCDLAGTVLAASDGNPGTGPDTTVCQIRRFVGGNAGDQHTNVAAVTVADDDGNEAADQDDAVVDITDVTPTISATKNGSPSSVAEPGANVVFSAAVTNTSVEPVTITALTDAVGGGAPFDVTTVAGPVLATTCGDAVGTVLAPSAGYSCSFTLFVAGNGGDTVTDVIEFTVVDDDGNTVTADDDEDTDLTDVLPALTLTKSAGVAEVVEPGANVTFGLVVTNPSIETVTITALTDAVDGGAAFDVTTVASPVLATTCGDAVGTALAPAGTYSCTFTVFVGGNAGDTVTDVAVVTGEDDEGNEATDDDDEDVDVTDSTPGITVTKNANVSEVPEPGADVAFTFLIENSSVEPVTITSLVDSVFGDILDECGLTGAVLAAADATLGSGPDSTTCTITRFIGGNAGDTHTNVITVTAEDDEGNEATDDDDEDVDITDSTPGITVTKNANVSEVTEPGADVEFSFLIENTSVEPVTITSLVDSVFGDILDECGLTGAVLEAADGTLGSGPDSTTCTITRFIGGNAGDLHTNVITVTAEDDEGNETTDDDDEDVEITDLEPGITIVKSADVAQVPEPGADVEFTFDITNTTAEAVTITSLVDSVFGDILTECGLAGAVLAGNDSTACTIVRFIGGDAGDLHTNVITVIAEDDEGNETTDDDDEDVDIVDVLPELVITKQASVSEVTEPGATVDFTFVIDNPSVEAVTITSLVDSVFGDILTECRLAGAVVAPGGSVSCTIARFVSGNAGDLHTNVVTVTGEDDEGNETTDDDDEEIDVIDTVPTIETTKSDGDVTVDAPGAVVTFTVDVENTSAENVTIVSIVDRIDGGDAIDVTVVGDIVEATTCATGVVIAPGDTYTCTFDLRVEGDGSRSIADVIDVTVVDDEGNEASDDDDEDTPVNAIADVAIVKTADVTVGASGSQVVYTLSVVNNGPSTATNVVVIDELPAGLTLVAASATAGWECDEPADDVVRCRILALSPGAEGTITVTTEIVEGTAGEVINQASVSTDTPDSDPSNNDDPAGVTVTVVEPPAQTPPTTNPPLAFTGRTFAQLLMFGAILLSIGMLLTGGGLLVRQRREPLA